MEFHRCLCTGRARCGPRAQRDPAPIAVAIHLPQPVGHSAVPRRSDSLAGEDLLDDLLIDRIVLGNQDRQRDLFGQAHAAQNRGRLYEGAPPQVDLAVTRFHTDEDFLNVMNTELVAGRFFNKEFRGDSSNYILNEAAIRKIGWTNEGAIGKKFGQEARRGQVIGVVKDFNFRHLGTPITPFVFFPPIRANRFERGRIAVRVNGDLQATLAAMEKIWSELVPEWPFKYSFVEEAVARQYQTELKLGKLTDVFSAISIFISIMGLLGLALFAISQQVKEIGIRKVLGADRNHLVIITTRDFLILVSAGIAVGIPLTYYVMYKWLQGYAYHTDLNIYSFAIAVIVSLLAALITISPVALQASSANPIDALKQE